MEDERRTITEDGPGEFLIRLPGPGLGEVAVSDVVEFLRGVVDLVAYAAAAELAKPIGQPGRRGMAIEEASRVRLLGLTNGSLVAEFAPAAPPPAPDSMALDAASLSQIGLDAVFDAVEGKRHPELAGPLAAFARRMSSRRQGQPVEFIDRRGPTEIVTSLDAGAADQLQAAEGEPTYETAPSDRLTGRIFEADVDADQARLRTPAGETVRIEYEADLEPEIKRLLGDRASLGGRVAYDPATGRARSIHATDILAGDQLEFDAVDFWHEPSMTELAQGVGAQPVGDPDELHFDATDSEWDELYGVLRAAD